MNPPAAGSRNATRPRTCWITGVGGLIGHALHQSPHRPAGWAVHGWRRPDLDLTDPTAVRAAFRQAPPDAILHCAAMSRSPACQADAAGAWRINVDATRHLADLAHDIPFVFLSTDLVFDGRLGGYREVDPVNPLSVYAETKVAAEQAVRSHPRHLVLRTSLNHGTSPTGDRAFNEETVAAWRAGRVTRLFTDEFRSPIHADITARATWELLATGATGLLHLAGSERLSRWEIGQHLAGRHPETTPLLEPASLAEHRGAPRPPDTSLDSSRAQELLSFRLPRYRDVV